MHLDYRAPDDLARAVERLVDDQIASKIAAQNPTLWGKEAEEESAKRLGWVRLPQTSRPLLAEIEALQAELREEGVTRVVLAGMGGSSLAPEVICASDGVELVTLDTTDPGQVAAAFATDLERTVVVVSSKSGGTVETDSHRRTAEQLLSDAGIDPASRIVVVTDPGSPLQKASEEAGYRKVFLADPSVGGRYSALTAFGLVPSGLAGADISALLDDAADVAGDLAADSIDNPALVLGALMAAAERSGSEKLVFAPAGTANEGFADWVEQLIAESTGKQGKGILPVAVAGRDSPGFADAGGDAVKVALGTGPVPNGGAAYAVANDGPLGAQFLLWETATAVAGHLIGINPFDQPNVEEAKAMARELLDAPSGAAAEEPLLQDDVLAVYAFGDELTGCDSLEDAIGRLIAAVPDAGYLAVMAYLDRMRDTAIEPIRDELARRAGTQVTFGWGPRFLHSTGQYHKGGHQNGAFLQITADCESDLAVPGRGYSFHTLQLAQAAGDGAVLADKNRPVLRVHLKDRAAGIRAVLAAVRVS
ncbi:glucose-6-phosphate isomerase [Blastococcus sp. Marseille-P5729]|uniref:glucose-6-phosphate isomerase n=1 Tax=Blastococcus sp. Marseille-P5729 TaxID=2086582 RepID=UPI000D1083C1|nr:glucose-6-phosphate isomerase [Blastococcus sp. Marseille-P5729]